jgi:hypothetical protein
VRVLVGQALGGEVANEDERAYIDVVFIPNRRTSNLASSSNRRPGLRLQNTRRLTDQEAWSKSAEVSEGMDVEA